MEIMINLKVSDVFTDVAVLKALSELKYLMEQKYSSHVVRTYSLTDIVKNLNKTLGDGSKENYNLPKNSIMNLFSIFPRVYFSLQNIFRQ